MNAKKLLSTALVIAFFSLLIPTETVAQNNQPLYALVTTLKVDRNKGAQYEELIKTYSDKIWKDRIERGELSSYALYAVTMSTGDPDDYNYVSVATSTSLGKLMEPAMAPMEIMKKAMAGTPQQTLDEIMSKYGAVREVHNSMIIRWAEGIMQAAGTERKFFQIRYIRTQPGKDADYGKMLREVTTPVMQTRIAGGEVNGWSAWEVVYPVSESSPFNFVTALSFSSWDKVTSSNFSSSYLKTFPKGDAVKMQAQLRDLRSIPREELWRQVYRVDNTSK